MCDHTTVKLGDIFAGAGGLSLGFVLASHPTVRYQPLFALDSDKNALASYRTSMEWLTGAARGIMPRVPLTFRRDLQEVNIPALLRLLRMKRGELDLLIGGPPCQGYSNANRKANRSKKSDQNRMSKIYFDILDKLAPKMFLVENVQGVRWTEPTGDMEIPSSQISLFSDESIPQDKLDSVQEYMILRASALGYKTWYGVLNAVDYGVPQTRFRFFLFGVKSQLVRDNTAISLDGILKSSIVASKTSVGDAIGDLPPLENGQTWAGEDYVPGENAYVKAMRQFLTNGQLHDHYTTRHAEYVIERYKMIPQGGNWEYIRNLMSNYSKIDNTHSNIYRRLVSNSPAITISHYRKSMIIHPTQDRGLSFREACRLQSFPDWYRFCGPSDERQQQLANAVPPLLAAQIASAIAQFWTSDAVLRNT